MTKNMRELSLNKIFGKNENNWNEVFLEELKIFKSYKKIVLVLNSSEGVFLTENDLKKIKDTLLNEISSFDIEIEILDKDEINKKEVINTFINESCKINKFNYFLEEEKDVIIGFFYVDVNQEEIEKIKAECLKYGLKFNYIRQKENTSIDNYLDKIKGEEEVICTNKLKEIPVAKEEKVMSDKKTLSKELSFGKPPKKEAEISKIKDLSQTIGEVFLDGIIFKVDYKYIPKIDKYIMYIYFTDYTESTYLKKFLDNETTLQYQESLKVGMGIKVYGNYIYDNFEKSSCIEAKFFEAYNVEPREDTANEKRIELHLHTNMSAQDGLSDPTSLIKRAKYWGHKAIAITDHCVVQGFPEAYKAGKDNDIKIIYGTEINLVNDYEKIIKNSNYLTDNINSFVVFDVETTGFSAKNNKIIEIGAVKISNGDIVDSYNILINPEESLSQEIVELTHINDSMLINQPIIDQVLPEFYNFIKDSIMVAHNANFDMAFLKNNFEKININFEKPYIDTLELSRIFYPNVRSHKLGVVAKRLGVSLENAHRAVDDARATGEVFIRLLGDRLKNPNFNFVIDEIQDLIKMREKEAGTSYHAIILAQNYEGLKNLYKIISKSHIDYFSYSPKVPKSILNEHRNGLLVSSACQDGELYQAIIRNFSEDRIEKIASYYDYFEIQPNKNNLNLIPEYFNSTKELENINKKIISIADKLNKLVVATGDVHYLDSESRLSRKILKHSLSLSRDEYDNDYFFMTTDEMLEEFSYLDARAYEVVIRNPQKICDVVEELLPIPTGTYPPRIEGSDEMLRDITYKKAHEVYGENLPENVKNRLKVELNSIIKNGYSVLYIIAQKLVKKANDDGYQVGSRGSVGSSLVATMCGITEVNPMPPHYSCPNCKYSEFINTEEMQVFSGNDLPLKSCPVCGENLNRLGDEIPFEVFLGFDGDKEPDIDLNFAGEYQSTAHKYTEELFGTGKVFRAGTIGTIAEKTAYGFVLKFIEETGINKSKAEIERLSNTLVGIKRTTGQHAGGVMIVPDYKDIHDFSPIQRPANDKNSDVTTTHYDYNAISGKILKLDILGHDVPTMIKMIEKLTGTDFMKAPLNDEKVLSLFNGSESLNLNKDIYDIDMGTLGIPEFGTNFVQKMLKSTKPSTFAELVRISGLSHGTNVWTNNAEELVSAGRAELKEVISTREDIMQDLIKAGAEKKFSFYTMEKVRKGKGLKPEEEEIISKLDLPDWYIDSLKKIQYMFPKAHAVAYVTMSVRLAYYKIYYPEAFYATYLSMKISNFDLDTISKGYQAIKDKMNEIKNKDVVSKKEKDDIAIYEIALEMYARGCKLGKLDLYNSEANRFTIIDNAIIPPFIAVPSLGESVANAIVESREESSFLSIEDLVKRTKISKTVIEYLKSIGILNNLNDSNQLSLF